MWSGTAVCLRLRGPHNLSFSTAGFNMSTRDLCRVEYLSGQVRTIGCTKPPTELAVVNESECVFRPSVATDAGEGYLCGIKLAFITINRSGMPAMPAKNQYGMWQRHMRSWRNS